MEFTRATAVYPKERELEYLALGLTSEAGEVAGKVKKMIRDNGGRLDYPTETALVSELGDVAWYLTRLCDHLEISLDTLLQENYNKLSKRKEAGTIQGSGDNR